MTSVSVRRQNRGGFSLSISGKNDPTIVSQREFQMYDADLVADELGLITDDEVVEAFDEADMMGESSFMSPLKHGEVAKFLLRAREDSKKEEPLEEKKLNKEDTMRIEKKKEENDNIIELSDDLRLPGTDVLLEKGDKIVIVKEDEENEEDKKKEIKESHIGRSMTASIIDSLQEKGPYLSEMGYQLRQMEERRLVLPQFVKVSDYLIFEDLELELKKLGISDVVVTELGMNPPDYIGLLHSDSNKYDALIKELTEYFNV